MAVACLREQEDIRIILLISLVQELANTMHRIDSIIGTNHQPRPCGTIPGVPAVIIHFLSANDFADTIVYANRTTDFTAFQEIFHFAVALR